MKRIVFAIAALLALATVRADAYVVPSVTRTCSGDIEAFALVKAATTAGRVTVFLHTDSVVLVTGVALTACENGTQTQVMEVQGVMTQVVSDGTTTIHSGDPVRPSDTVDGRVMKGVADSNVVCSAMQNASSTPGTRFNCL
jgi:Iap family predicted aminopeptidase